jgi:hypothetical protein
MSDNEILERLKEKEIDKKFLEKNFDSINVVVDTLLSPNPLKQSISQLNQLNSFLDASVNLLA